MLFAAGMAIPPGTRNLGDYIDANDPCTLNPNDPICQATAADVANDPCRLNPKLPYCQQGLNPQDLPTDASKWDQYIDPTAATATPSWVTRVVNAITLKPTNAPASPLATSLGKVPWAPIALVLTIAGGYFAFSKYRERRLKTAS